MITKKEELLSYIRLLYQRGVERDSKAGMTLWAILAGLVGVTWHLFNSYSKLNQSELTEGDFYVIFSMAYTIIYLTALIFPLELSLKSRTPFDYRKMRMPSIELHNCLPEFAVHIIPLYIIFKAKNVISPSLGFVDTLLTINFWFMFIGLIIFSITYLSFFFQSKNNFPMVSFLASLNSKSYTAFYNIFYLIFFALFSFNAYFLLEQILENKITSSLTIIALDIALILKGISILSNKANAKQNLIQLSRLERDIVIHDIKTEEIRERLQSEILGVYIGDWLNGYIKKLVAKKLELIQLYDSYPQAIEKIYSIKKEYMDEIKARLNKLNTEKEELSESYNKLANPLIDWLNEIQSKPHVHSDAFIGEMLADCLKDLKKHSEDIEEASSKQKQLTKECTKKFNAQKS